MRRFRAVLLTIWIVTLAGPPSLARQAPPQGAPAKLQLTVDSIMRGPDLVGWPPAGVRWAADSWRLYFDWRKPAETEPSTYVLDLDGAEPRRLTDDEVRHAPPSAGLWDDARQRVLFVDDGDVVLHDGTRGGPPLLVHLLPRVHVPQPAGLARLRGPGRGLPRQRGIRPRVAQGGLPTRGPRFLN